MPMTHTRVASCRLFYTVILLCLGAIPTLTTAQSEQPDTGPAQQEATNTNAYQSMTLTQAVTRTLAQHPQLHQYAIKKNRILGQRKTSSLSPGLNLGIEVENIGGSGDYSDIESAETTLSLSSVIELGDKKAARTAVLDTELNVAEYQNQALTLDILGQLNAEFINTLETQQLLSLAKEARDLAENTQTIVKSRSGKGAAPDSDVARANALLAKAQLQLDALQRQHERSLIRLASFWGEDSFPASRVDGELYDFGPQPDFYDLYERAIDSPAITVFASEGRLKAAELKLTKAQSETDIDWSVGIRRFEQTEDAALVAGVSIPLFSGKRNSGDLSRAMAERDEIELRRRNALNQLNTRLFDAYSLRAQQVNAVAAYRNTIIPELTSSLKTTQRAYETGRYSYQDWIAAQKELIDAKQSLIASAAAALLNQAVIEQLIAKPFINKPDSY